MQIVADFYLGLSDSGMNNFDVSESKLGLPPGRFIKFTAEAPFTAYFPFLPGFSDDMTVTEQLTMRIR